MFGPQLLSTFPGTFKKTYIQWLFLFVFSSLLFSAQGQDKFPDRCIGRWGGTLYMYNNGIIRDSVEVLLTIAPINDTSWIWKTEYLSQKQPLVKDYQLKYLEKNVFITDEGEGIELLNYQFENKLFSTFETQGIYLTAKYELIDDNLIFELTSGKKKNEANSITNYSIDAVQYIRFSRMK